MKQRNNFGTPERAFPIVAGHETRSPNVARTDSGTEVRNGRKTLSYGGHFVWFDLNSRNVTELSSQVRIM